MKKLFLLAVWATLFSGCAATALTAPAGPGGEAVVWRFDTPSWATGRLGDIAPDLAQGRDIRIYIAIPRLYMPDI
jgi:hypothetical protein